jgi:hypothetical protein
MTDIDQYALGTIVTVYGDFDVASVPTDPGSTTLTVQDPAGGETTYTYPASPIVRDSAGRFHADLVPDAAGIWKYRWAGVGLADGASEGQFYIEASFVGTDEYTYDPGNDIGQVRLLADDRDLSKTTGIPARLRSVIFTDAEIQVFLNASGSNVFFAAALALQTIAINRVLLIQRRQIGKTDVDYGTLRSDLLKAAQTLREQAVVVGTDPNAPADGFAEQVWDDFSMRRVVENVVLRDA